MLSPIQTKRFFNQSNYTQVALFGDRGCWETYAACALIGKTSEALNYFRKCSDFPDALFYAGVAHWMNGEDELAYGALNKVNNLHAQNLCSFIQKKKIHVLAQVPWIRNHFTDWLAGVSNDPKFQVNNVSFHPNDIANKPYADIHQFYPPNTPPDFYICQMVEWHLIPTNIQELTCPIFGQTADYDLHIQAVYPWLQLFDELLVTDGTEWNDISKLVSVPVSTFPKSFCLLKDLPELQVKHREVDLYLSGTVTHPYHPDKAHLLSRILRIPELNIKVVHGFTGTEDYYGNLSNSKVCFTYVRHPGATSTRGLEALSLGCALVVQEESVLRLFVGEEEGVITYSYDRGNLVSQLTHVAQNWSEYQAKAHKGAQVIRAEFSTEKVASQYLRYLTVLAAKPGVASQRQPVNQNRLFQKRTVLEKGWLPSHNLSRNGVLKKIYQANRARLANIQKMDTPSPQTAINLARETILFHYHHSLQSILFSPAWLHEIEHIYQEALNQFPQALVLHFNLFRTRIHFGSPAKVSQAIKSALEILDKPHDYWQVSKWDDVFPYDIFHTYFNYRSYFDSIVATLQAEEDSFNKQSNQLILASIHYYLGLYTCEVSHFEKACALDPAFATYKMAYLKQGMRNNKDFLESKTARTILRELVQGTIEFLAAERLIQNQCSVRNITVRQLLGLDIFPVYTSINVVEHSSANLLRPSIGKLVNPFKDIAFTKKIVRDFVKTSQRTLIGKLPKGLKDRLKRILLFKVKDVLTDCVISINAAKIRILQRFYAIKPVESSSSMEPRTYAKEPKLLGSTKHHNYVLLGKTYYGVPKALGELNLQQVDLDALDGHGKIIRQTSLKALKLACKSSRPKYHAKIPRLVSSTRHYNCVIWGETYYGIPKFFGDLDLHKIHLADYSMIICEPSLKALKRSLKGPIFPHLRLRNSNVVKPETTSSGAPSSLSKMDLLKKIYQMKRSPFWGFTRRAACLDAGLPLEAMPTEQLCQQFEHLDRTTRGEHMRRYGLGLLDSVRSLSMRSLNIQASPRGYKVISMHPTLVESLASYHLFYFRGAFYGVPVAFGDVNLTHFEKYDAGSILFDSDLASLKRRITEGEGVYAQPTLLESLKFYYIVAWGQDFYAVPTIYSNLKKSVNSEVIAEILNANHKTIFRDISVLNLRKRVRNCESIYQIICLKRSEVFATPDINMTEQPTEEIFQDIARLEQTQVWRLRVIGWRIKRKLSVLVARFIG